MLLPTIAIIITVLASAELYLRSLPNDFKYRANYMNEHVSEIKVLVIGASCTAMGVKPSYFDWQPSFSLAYANQPILYSYLILNNYIDRMDSLRCVVMDATYGGLWDKGQNAKSFLKRYSIYYGLNDFKGFENNYEISANIKDIYKRLIHESDRAAFTTCDLDGFQSRYFVNIPYDDEKWKTHGQKFSVEHTLFNTTIDNDDAQKVCGDNYVLLNQIVSLCEKRKVKVLFVSTPCHPYYYNGYNPIQKGIVDSTFAALCREFNNVKWFDYTESEYFNNEDFSNSNHLNTNGAIKLTKMLNDSIEKWN